jgi:hypothetical protein
MSIPVEISDDDDSFLENERPSPKKPRGNNETISISSENDNDTNELSGDSIQSLTSDEDEKLPEVTIRNNKSSIIKRLFPARGKPAPTREKPASFGESSKNVPSTSSTGPTKPIVEPEAPRNPGINKMIGGVPVNMPVDPYGCQIALMSKVSI